MRKRACLFLMAFCLLLTACKPAAQPYEETDTSLPPTEEASAPGEVPTPETSPEPELSERDRNWINDIHYLQSQYKMYHPDPFYLCPEEEFDWKIDRLCQKVNILSDNDIYFEMAAIIAGMGDVHTSVRMPESLYEYWFPFGVVHCDGKLYLRFYLEEYEQFEPYLLREIVAVNGVDISYLERKFESYIGLNNPWYSRELFPIYFIPAFFDWAGCGYQDGYTIQILDENQNIQSVEAPLVPYAEYEAAPAVFPESWAYLSEVEEVNWTEYRDGKNGGYVYINLEQMSLGESQYRKLFEKAAELMEAHPDCGKLVIDLRRNHGGYMEVHGYLREDVQIIKDLSIDQTYILTGGFTASAAMECIGLFKEELDAVTVGEPTGQFTSFFNYKVNYTGLTLTLPQSQIDVTVATGWYEGNNYAGAAYDEEGRLYEWENTILPDVYIHQDIEDLRQGRNSALKWILEQ